MTHAPRRPRRSTAALAACCLGLTLAGGVGAAHAAAGDPLSLSYDSFSSTAGLSLVGSAAQADDRLRLTPARNGQAGAAWALSTVDPTQDISTDFSVDLHDTTSCPADGLDFVLQDSAGGNGAIGDFGGSMGYAGVENSFAVELDDYPYNYGDPGVHHVGFLSGGDTTNIDYPSSWTSTAVPSLYGAPVHVWLDYTAATSSMRLYVSSDDTKPADPTLDATVDLSSLVPGHQAFAGFTAGTGACNQVQDVTGWHLSGVEGQEADTALALTSSAGPRSRSSQPTFTATVARTDGDPALPTGQVVFSVDGVDQPPVDLGPDGTAAFVPTYPLNQGVHRVGARYLGDDAADPATNTVSYEVLANDSRIKILHQDPFGSGSVQPYGVPLSVAVGPRAPKASQPQGTVRVYAYPSAGGDPLTTSGPLRDGKLKLPADFLEVGNYEIYAQFEPSGPGTYASVGSLASIRKQRSTTTLSSATAKGATVLSATVRSEVRGPKPTGTVTFYSDGDEIGTGTVRSGVAKLATRLPAGSHSVTATYDGSAHVERSDTPAITVAGGA